MLSYRAHGPEVQAQNKPDLMQHNNSTQTDIFYGQAAGGQGRSWAPWRQQLLPAQAVLRGTLLRLPPGLSQRVPAQPELPSAQMPRGGRGARPADVRSPATLLPFETEVGSCGRQRPPWTEQSLTTPTAVGPGPRLCSAQTREALCLQEAKAKKIYQRPNLSNAPRRPQNRLLAPRLWACPFPPALQGWDLWQPKTSQER